MDVKHIDMKCLGIFGIFKETYKIINRNRKIFAMAAICFIHPLNYLISGFLGSLNHLLTNLYEYGNISHIFSHNYRSFSWPLNVFYILFLFGYSIFSTAGMSLTVAGVYSGRESLIKDTMSVVSKVWKRVLVTFLCVILVLLVFHIIAGFAFFLIVWMMSIMKQHGPFGEIDVKTFVVFLVFYFVGLLYLVVILQLAGTVSVLEDSCGFKAMAKSRLLLKGKMVSATILVLAIWSGFGIILWLDGLVRKLSFLSSIMIGMFALVNFLLLFLIFVFLFWKLVSETMLYFVCKSYHRESIDMSALFDQDHIIPLRSSEC